MKKTCSLVRLLSSYPYLPSLNYIDGYHIYRDRTAFPYAITLARPNLLTNQNKRYHLKVCQPHLYLPQPIPLLHPLLPMFSPLPRPRARVQSPRAQRLQLYESHAVPKLFACYTKYSAPDGSGNGHEKAKVLAPIGSSFETAFEIFKKFFELKTRRQWDNRLGEANAEIDDREKKGEEEVFIYTPPKQGEPRGLIYDSGDDDGGTFGNGKEILNQLGLA